MSQIDVGHWFPFRGHATEEIGITEPADGWESVRNDRHRTAHFQWLAKTIAGTATGFLTDAVSEDPIGFSVGFEIPLRLVTTYAALRAQFVGAESDFRVSQAATFEAPIETTPATFLYVSIGGIWAVGTEADPDVFTADPLRRYPGSLDSFIVPASFQLGSSGGDTNDPDYPGDGLNPVVGRFNLSSPGAPTDRDFSLSFNLFAFRSNQVVECTELNVDATVTEWLTLPAVP